MSRKNRKLIILAITILAISSLACAVLDSILPDVGGGSSSADTIRVSDDFSDQSSGWEIGSYEFGDVGYHDGKYRVTSEGNSTMWGAAGLNFQDVMIEIEATQIVGPDNNNNDYGVICRLQPEGNGYYGLVSGDGFYTIIRLSGEEDVEILVDWTESRLINQGNATNQIGLSCQGNQIALFINNKLVAETSDSMFSSGDIGLTTASYEESQGTVIDFDNLIVK